MNTNFSPLSLSFSSRRQVLPAENAPTVAESFESEIRTVEEHAHMRVQIFYSKCVALFNTATNTPKVKILRAPYQVGQASGENHAAHPNPCSGFSDTRRKEIMREITNDQMVTPKKAKILKMKGFDTPTRDQMENDPSTVRSLFNDIWPHDSLLSGSEGEILFNATTYVHRKVNLSVDLPMERKFRKKEYPELFQAVMTGKMSPREATEKFISLNDQHFAEKLKLVKSKRVVDYTLAEKKGNLLARNSLDLLEAQTDNNSQKNLLKRK